MEDIIKITESAEEYLYKLLIDKNDVNLAIKIFITDPGTPKAETCLSFCNIKEQISEDNTIIELKDFKVFIENRSIPFLDDAEINFDTDNFGGQLTIKSPNSRIPNISKDSPLEDQVNYVIYNEINPMLESHGGSVHLVEITNKGEAILQFGGGCQGCGMVDVTLKDGIEKTLLDQFDDLNAVKDITDHSVTDNAYY